MIALARRTSDSSISIDPAVSTVVALQDFRQRRSERCKLPMKGNITREQFYVSPWDNTEATAPVNVMLYKTIVRKFCCIGPFSCNTRVFFTPA